MSASPTRILWLDAADNASLTTDAFGNVTSWTSKEGNDYIAQGSTSAFGIDPDATPVSGTAGGPWVSVYISSSGMTAFAVPEHVDTGNIIRSNDYGRTWQPVSISLTTRLNQIAFSSTGQYIVAVGDEDYVYVSSDYGANFAQMLSDATRSWEWCWISENGRYVLVSAFGDGVFRSSDYGQTFTLVDALPTDVVDMGFLYISNANPAIQFAGYFGGQVYRSLDSGVTWNPVTTLPSESWYDMKQSGDGSVLIVWADPGNIYSSTDNGDTWNNLTPDMPDGYWIDVRISVDASSIVAVQRPGFLYMSRDGGETWINPIDTTSRFWTECGISADGKYVVAGADVIYSSNDGGITFSTDGTSVSNFSVEISQSPTALMVYSIYDKGVFMVANNNPKIITLNNKQYIYFETAQMSIAGIDLGTRFSMFLVYQLSNAYGGAMWSFDDTHAFYPRSDDTTTMGFGVTTVSLSPSPIMVGKAQVSNVTLNATDLKLYENTTVEYDRQYTATANGTTMVLGNSAVPGADEFFHGYLGEIIVYDSELSPADFNSVMTYLAGKWGIAEAYPVVAGVGSDPHLVTLDGRRFDITAPGSYTLMSVGADFSVVFDVAHLKMKRGLYITKMSVRNGPYHGIVNFTNRGTTTIKKKYDSPIHFLEVDTSDSIKWDVHPKAPKRMTQVLHGRHSVLGRFWLYVDMKHRYIVPLLPDLKNWDRLDGLLMRPETDKFFKKKIKTNWKKVDRSFVERKTGSQQNQKQNVG